MHEDESAAARRIARELCVDATFDPDREIEGRIGFLADALRKSGRTGLVLGISGGVDSATAGRLCQLAAEQARASGHAASFVAMRLPLRASDV